MQVMTAGQKVLFEYHGNNYSFTVSQAAVEGQEKSNSPERGMVSEDTYIVFEASRDSGIKVSFLIFFWHLLYFAQFFLGTFQMLTWLSSLI